MRADVPLRQLAESRLLAGLRVGGGGQDRADVLLEFLIDERVILIIRDAQQILLRGRGELQPDGRVCDRPDIALDQAPHRLLDPGPAEGLVAGRVPDQRLHEGPPHALAETLRGPALAAPPEDDDRVVRVVVHDGRRPVRDVHVVRCRVDDGEAAVDPPGGAVPEAGRGCRAVETDLAADVRIPAQRREGAAELQLVPGRRHVGRDQVVRLHDAVQLLHGLALGADEAVEHAPRREDVHALRAPGAADLKTAHPLRQSDAEVDAAERDLALVVAVFLLVLCRVLVVDLQQALQLVAFNISQTGDPVRIHSQRHVGPLLNRFSFFSWGRVCSSSRPRAPAPRPRPGWSFLRRSPSHPRWAA